MLVRREAILFDAESTYRDATVPDLAQDCVFCFDAQWSNDAKTLQRQGPSDTLASFQSVYGGRTATMTFKVELKGKGAAGGTPEFDKLLQCCGMTKTVDAGVSVTYTTRTASIPSGALYYYQDGKLKVMRGVRGNAKFVLQAREYGYIEFTMHGHPDAEIDSAMIDPVYDAVLPPQVVGGAVAIGGTAIEVTKLEIDLGNEIAKPMSINEDNGVGQIRIASRDVTGNIDPESVLVATEPFEGDWTSSNSQAFTTVAIGATAGNIYTITAPAIYYKDLQEGDREGIRTQEITCGFAESSGNDEISIAFT